MESLIYFNILFLALNSFAAGLEYKKSKIMFLFNLIPAMLNLLAVVVNEIYK